MDYVEACRVAEGIANKTLIGMLFDAGSHFYVAFSEDGPTTLHFFAPIKSGAIVTKRHLLILILALLVAIVILATTTRIAKPPTATPCSEAWYAYLEKEYATPSDGEGHGPDRATVEWFHSFEWQTGLPVSNGRETIQHCQAIQQQLQRRTIVISSLMGVITIRR